MHGKPIIATITHVELRHARRGEGEPVVEYQYTIGGVGHTSSSLFADDMGGPTEQHRRRTLYNSLQGIRAVRIIPAWYVRVVVDG